MHCPDARFSTNLDKIRARTWFQFLVESTEFESRYKLAKALGCQATQLKNYAEGGQPSEPVLEAAECIAPGSLDVYRVGPVDLKLWAVLKFDSPDDLGLVAEHSNRCDAAIANFKLKVIQHPELLESEAWPTLSKGFPLEDDYWDVVVTVSMEVSNQVANDVHSLLTDWYSEILAVVRAQGNDQFLRGLVPQVYSDQDIRQMVRELAFEGLALPTVGRKGTRGSREGS